MVLSGENAIAEGFQPTGNVRDDVHGLGVDHRNRVDAGLGYIEAPGVHHQAARHHAAQRAALRILETRANEGRERRLVQTTRLPSSLIFTTESWWASETYTKSSSQATPVGAAPPTVSPSSSADPRSQAQLGGDGGVLAVAHVVGPQRTALLGVLVAQAVNLLAFRR